MATATRTRTTYRSSVSGKYVQKDTARRRPRTTVTERDKVKTSSKKSTPSTARATVRRGTSTRTSRR